MLGSSIGQYRIVREIGAGGMGRVFAAEHVLLGRRAAIKTLLPTLAVHPEIVERFFTEARATSSIHDPGVIQIYDFGYHVDGTAYIVMELLEGESLAARLERAGRLSVAEALRIARQLANSLSAAHGNGIVHRDLKPENIYLIPDREAQGGERPKILDFGICKLVGPSDPNLTQIGTTFGTPAYMAPEQCRGARDIDHRADIYALGCLMFHMISGRPPFLGESPADFLAAHIRDAAPPPSKYARGLPPEVDALVLRCLGKQPDQRFASMFDLADAIGQLTVTVAIDTALVDAMIEDAVDEAIDAVEREVAAAAAPEAEPKILVDNVVHEPEPEKKVENKPEQKPEKTAEPAPELSGDVFLEPPPRKRRGAIAAIALVLLAALGTMAGAVIVFVGDDADVPAANAAAIAAPVAPVATKPAAVTKPAVVAKPPVTKPVAKPAVTQTPTAAVAPKPVVEVAKPPPVDAVYPPTKATKPMRSAERPTTRAKRQTVIKRVVPSRPSRRTHATRSSEDLYDTR